MCRAVLSRLRASRSGIPISQRLTIRFPSRASTLKTYPPAVNFKLSFSVSCSWPSLALFNAYPPEVLYRRRYDEAVKQTERLEETRGAFLALRLYDVMSSRVPPNWTGELRGYRGSNIC